MKKILITLLLLATPSLALASFDTNLKFGSKGDAVKQLQAFVGVEQTGYFGNGTRKAVVEWQKKNGLPAQGVWGAMSRGVANKQSANNAYSSSTGAGIAQVASSTVSKVETVASSTREIDWHFEVATSTKTISYGNSSWVDDSRQLVKLSFFPMYKDNGTLANVTRCEYTVKNPSMLDEVKQISYESKGYVEFEATVMPKSFVKTNVQCVAFDWKDLGNGYREYKEYKSPVIEIK